MKKINRKKKNSYIADIYIPESIYIEKQENILIFIGPLGSTLLHLKKLDKKGIGAVDVNMKKNIIKVSSSCKSFFGAIQAIIKNKLQGISRGFVVYIRIIGLGYRASMEPLSTSCNEQTIFFKLGFSHQVWYKTPKSIRVFLVEPTLICIYGLDKNQVTQIAAKIRQIKPPTVYKGKGIRLINETVHLKEGKQK